MIRPAEVPESPASPKPLRTGILALVLGLMLGVGLAFLRDFLDDAIRGDDDAVRAAQAPILGHIPYRVETEKDKRLATLVDEFSPKAERSGRCAPTSGSCSTEVSRTGAAATRWAVRSSSPARWRPNVRPPLRPTSPSRPLGPAARCCSSTPICVAPALPRSSVLIVYDTAPVLAVADTLEVVPIASKTVIVVDVREASRRGVRHAADKLRAVDADVAGTVLNNVTSGDRYYYSYDYYDYRPDTAPEAATSSGAWSATRPSGSGPDVEGGPSEPAEQPGATERPSATDRAGTGTAERPPPFTPASPPGSAPSSPPSPSSPSSNGPSAGVPATDEAPQDEPSDRGDAPPTDEHPSDDQPTDARRSDERPSDERPLDAAWYRER